jgi:mutator protein MutT
MADGRDQHEREADHKGRGSSGGRRFVEVAIAVVFEADHSRLLICQRKADAVLGGYWEFPGGKCDAAETPADGACREVLEETGIVVRAVRALPVIEHDYPHGLVRLHPFLCERVSGEVKLLAVAAAKWIAPGEVTGYRFPEANRELVEAVARGYAALIGP